MEQGHLRSDWLHRLRAGMRGLALLAAVLLAACGDHEPKSKPAPEPDPVPAVEEAGPECFAWLQDVGKGWTHRSGGSDEMRLPEVMCGGVVLLDYDGDGDQDVFLVQGGVWPDLQSGGPGRGNALLRNDGDWSFVDVAEQAGIAGKPTDYGMGAVASDYDNDGDVDLYVTCFEDNVLYQNQGDGTFVDRTAAAGLGGGAVWSASACWFDADRDGFLDLYVVNYLNYSHAENKKKDCGVGTGGHRDYCSPKEFPGAQDFFFHNQGDGKFVEQALAVGLQCPEPIQNHGKGLGVVVMDVEGDGDEDLFVTNDSTPNFLFVNDGQGGFEESGLYRGCAYGEDGQAQAGMGTDAGDFDGDGDEDLWVVHLDYESNALYRNDGEGVFSDENADAGLAIDAVGMVGFGTDFFDFDNDADLDLVITNGHVLIHVEESLGSLTYRQKDQLFENLGGGRFQCIEARRAGQYFEHKNVGRGLASGDLDGDGDLDLVIVPRDEPAVVLRNQTRENGSEQRAILLHLVGGKSNRSAVGARVQLRIGESAQYGTVRAGTSYCSSNDLRLHFGVGTAATIDAVQIHWPSGEVELLDGLSADAEHRIEEGKGVTASKAFQAGH